MKKKQIIKMTFLALVMQFCFLHNSSAIQDVEDYSVFDAYRIIKGKEGPMCAVVEIAEYLRGIRVAYMSISKTKNARSCCDKFPFVIEDIIFGKYFEGEINGDANFTSEVLKIFNNCLKKK